MSDDKLEAIITEFADDNQCISYEAFEKAASKYSQLLDFVTVTLSSRFHSPILSKKEIV